MIRRYKAIPVRYAGIIFCQKSIFDKCASVISLSYGYDSKLPIVLFVGRCFSDFRGIIVFLQWL